MEIGVNPIILNFNNGQTVQVQRSFWEKNKLDEYDVVKAKMHGKMIVFYGEHLSDEEKSKMAPKKEVQTEFDVELVSFNDKKVQVVKTVKDALGLALREAMDLVSNAPVVITEKISEEYANELKEKIEAVGGEVKIK